MDLFYSEKNAYIKKLSHLSVIICRHFKINKNKHKQAYSISVNQYTVLT